MASSAVNSALSLLELTLASNGEPTRGRWAREAPTLGRATSLVGRPKSVAKRPHFRVVGCLLGPHVMYVGHGLS